MTAVLESPARVVPEEAGSNSAALVNTMKASALFTALSDALLFTAHPSARLPMLEAVRLEFGAGQLVAVATDRFVLGVSRVDYAGAAFTMLITGVDAKALVKMAKTAKRDASSREVSIEVDDVASRGQITVTFRFSTGEAMTARGADVEFPKWRHLLPADSSRMGGLVGMGYNPSRLGRFSKVRAAEQGAGLQMVVFPTTASNGEPGPTAITIGDNFFGMVMPIRPCGGEWKFTRPGWLDVAAAGSVVDQESAA